MAEKSGSVSYLEYLQGGGSVLALPVGEGKADRLAMDIAYYIKHKGYHRQRLAEGILELMHGPDKAYRETAWAFLQMPEYPLSHIMELVGKVTKKLNSRSLRMALALRLANSSKEEIARAFFISPVEFRKMWARMYLPRKMCDDQEIKNKSYLFAMELGHRTIPEAMAWMKVTPVDLVKRYGIPLHIVMGFVTAREDMEALAKITNADDFMRHSRNFRNLLGDEDFDKIATGKVKEVTDPNSLLAIEQHLVETGAVTPKLKKQLETRAEENLEEVLKKYQLESLAIFIDISQSMESAVELTKQLYAGLKHIKIDHMIAFNEHAQNVLPSQIDKLRCDGMTSIGAAVVRLKQNIDGGKPKPQAIILVSDMDENSLPYLRATVGLIPGIPIIGLQLRVGNRDVPCGEHPSATIKVSEFHPRLLKDILERIVRLTAKVSVTEKEITQTVKTTRHVLEEEIHDVELPVRDPATLKPGYLPKVLAKA